MRQLKLTVTKSKRHKVEIEVSYLKEGEWCPLPTKIEVPTGDYSLPKGAAATIYPDDFDTP